MKGTARVTNPEAVELTLSITATVGDWQKLVEQLGTNYPSWALTQIVRNTIIASVGRVETEHAVNP